MMKCRIVRHFIWVFTVCKSTHCEKRAKGEVDCKSNVLFPKFPAIGFREVIKAN